MCLPHALDGWEQAKAQFVLQNGFQILDPNDLGDLRHMGVGDAALFEYPVGRLIEFGLVHVVRSLTRVLSLRWVSGLSPEEGWAACRVLDELLSRRSGWFLRATLDKLQQRAHNDQVDDLSYAWKMFR